MVEIVGSHFGFETIFINASDKRSKKMIESILKESCESHSMEQFWGENKLSKRLIVMDEVDGCSAGDRGGIAALIKVIEKCRQPIVCIANDHGSRKISSLLTHCYDIKLVKPV
jgi:replication factor C subunit 1